MLRLVLTFNATVWLQTYDTNIYKLHMQRSFFTISFLVVTNQKDELKIEKTTCPAPFPVPAR